uniref:DNA replication complex GINS protein PSF2 n=1 Tax=Acrobeloides nanus TaxID=290746 RepID=A0A914BW64_9BILA
MNPEQCEFLAENELILPNFNERTLQLICGDVGPFEAGVPIVVPIWLAVYLKKRHKCTIIPPDWLTIDELNRQIANENEHSAFSNVPKCFLEIAHIVLTHAKEDVEDIDQLKTLIADLWDKRVAKMRNSEIEFLKQHKFSYAQLDNLTQMEVACARPVLSTATKMIEKLNDAFHSISQI